jgi:hypothetical protein
MIHQVAVVMKPPVHPVPRHQYIFDSCFHVGQLVVVCGAQYGKPVVRRDESIRDYGWCVNKDEIEILGDL